MNKSEMNEIINNAQMIVDGYAFMQIKDNLLHIVSLHAPFHALIAIIKNRGILTDKEIRIIREFIKENYQEMFTKWSKLSDNSFYEEK